MTESNRRPLLSSGILLGIGLGGFFDGILFHQILQIHNMLSNRLFPSSVVNLEINMFWDGLFHAFTWIMTVTGLIMLWKAGGRRDVPWDTQTFAGSLALGWGIFNLVEGVINHHLLELHHVVQRAEGATRTAWDVTFLASGVILIAIGARLIKKSREPERAAHSRPTPPGKLTRVF